MRTLTCQGLPLLALLFAFAGPTVSACLRPSNAVPQVAQLRRASATVDSPTKQALEDQIGGQLAEPRDSDAKGAEDIINDAGLHLPARIKTEVKLEVSILQEHYRLHNLRTRDLLKDMSIGLRVSRSCQILLGVHKRLNPA